ncbi:MAG: hypothetical protein QOG03_2501 [Actinomycetota bacterium]|jgi:hypothetical protein|nr:hypothetical protein [Actinomycetota bacterium]
MTRGQVLTTTLLALAITVFSVAPSAAGVLADALDLRNRLFALLVTSVAVLLVLHLRTLSRLATVEERFGDLVRRLAIRQSLAEHGDQSRPGMVAIVIAAYNEEEAIGGVLSQLPDEVAGLEIEPIVVIDGGEDGTEAIVRKGGHMVATHPVNRGQGDALRTGFALALQRGADVIVTMDADGQHRPDEIVELVKPILLDEADYVQGSRFLGQYDDAGGSRDLGIRLFSRLINLLCGTSITDCTNGFRALRAEALAELRLEEDRYSSAELLMEAATKKLRILEIPVHVRSRSHGESKKPQRLGYPLGWLGAVIRVWLR